MLFLTLALGAGPALGTLGFPVAAQQADGGYPDHGGATTAHPPGTPPAAGDAGLALCRLLDWRPSGTRFGPEVRRVLPPPPDHIRIIDRPRERELVIEVGPISLPPRSEHHAIPQIPKQLAYFPFDAVVTGYRNGSDAAYRGVRARMIFRYSRRRSRCWR